MNIEHIKQRSYKGLRLLPAKKGTCPLCATDHTPDQPHNAQSLFYGVRFKMAYGHSPTWADAIAHCKAEVQEAWKQQLITRGAVIDSEHEPIAEPGGTE